MITLIIVIVLFFIIISEMSKSQDATNNYFTNLYNANQVFMEFASNNCYVVGSDFTDLGSNSLGNQLPSQIYTTVFDAKKLNANYFIDSDLPCTQNIPDLLGVRISTIDNGNKWYLGITQQSFNLPQKDISLFRVDSLPVAVKYDYKSIVPATLMLYSYQGRYVTLYDTIKESCLMEKNTKYLSMNLDNQISYNSTDNIFCMSDFCFRAMFYCNVSDFNISPGKRIISVKASNGFVDVS